MCDEVRAATLTAGWEHEMRVAQEVQCDRHNKTQACAIRVLSNHGSPPMNASRLRHILLEAAEHVPFYKQHWRAAGVDLTRVGSAVHLEFLPVVSKADLLACPPELRLDQRFSERAPHVEQALVRRRRWRFVTALRDVGYVPGEKVMLISDAPRASGVAFLRWTYVDPSCGESEVFATYARKRPHVLYGPLSSLVLLARRMLATPQVTCRPKLVVSTGEQLTDAQRSLLESAFNARVADFYELGAAGLVAYSRPGISGYHVLSKDFHLELLRVPGTTGLERLVITDLGDSAMPLIRFDTGDLVRRDGARAGSPIVGISGRDADGLPAASGECLSPYEVELALDRAERAGSRPTPETIESSTWGARAPWSEAALRP
jgi:phenylacetate-CoA ligase